MTDDVTDDVTDDDVREDEANESDGPLPEPPLPGRAALFGLTLVSAAFFPLLPDGRRFVDLVLEAFSRGAVEGLITVVGLGSPFLFGLAVALASRIRVPAFASRIVRPPIAIMHSQLIIVAWFAWTSGSAIAALPFLGFSIVSGIYFAVHLASARASGAGPTLRWHVRWGAMMVMAISAWGRLQMFGGISFGWGLTIALGSAAMLLRATRVELPPEQD